MFRDLLLRRYKQQATHMTDRDAERAHFMKTSRDLHEPPIKQPPLPERPQDDAPLQHNGSSATEQHSDSSPPLQHNNQPTERTRLPAFE